MDSVSGVFQSQADAKLAWERLVSEGLGRDRLVLLTPGSMPPDVRKRVPTSDTEQTGMGAAVGGVVGGALGMAGGAELGALAATIPGVGPVVALGVLGGAILALAGARVGNVVEDAMTKGLPADEIYIYEDTLRQGRSVIIAFPQAAESDSVRETLALSGAETIDAARKQWWVGLRDAEREHYRSEGRPFEQDEQYYRLGFETALDPQHAARDFEHFVSAALTSEAKAAFHAGYERGLDYRRQRRGEAA